MKVLEILVQYNCFTGALNPKVQLAPACILEPDHDRQREAGVHRLQEELPEMFILGKYNQEKRTGPAIRLCCIMAQKIEGLSCLLIRPIEKQREL